MRLLMLKNVFKQNLSKFGVLWSPNASSHEPKKIDNVRSTISFDNKMSSKATRLWALSIWAQRLCYVVTCYRRTEANFDD